VLTTNLVQHRRPDPCCCRGGLAVIDAARVGHLGCLDQQLPGRNPSRQLVREPSDGSLQVGKRIEALAVLPPSNRLHRRCE
jgi:hypothetical protein